MLPCRRPRSWKIMSSKSQNMVICLDLSLGSMLEVLVLKNAVECTSQRLKWTSGARVMNFVFNEVELSLTHVWRTWAIFDRRLTNLSYLWPTSDELVILDPRLSSTRYLLPTSVTLLISLSDVCRTWAIVDRRLSDLSLELFLNDVWRYD